MAALVRQSAGHVVIDSVGYLFGRLVGGGDMCGADLFNALSGLFWLWVILLGAVPLGICCHA